MAFTSDQSTVSGVLNDIASDVALTSVITEAIRDGVPEVSRLGECDVAEQVGLFVAAGLDAVAKRRPPTRHELDHVSTFASNRARQRIPVTALLASLHIGQHLTLEAVAKRLESTAPEVPPGAVMEAFAAHLRWAQAVESRIISSHREAEVTAAREAYDYEAELLRSLVVGPVLASHRSELAVRGIARDVGLWVLRTQADGRLAQGVVSLGDATLQARFADEHVMITSDYRPGTTSPVTMAVAGPVTAERIPDAYQLAGRVLDAAVRVGRTGVHSAATMATEMVRSEHPEIGRALAREHFGALDPADEWARVLVETFLLHLDNGQRLEATAAALFVHPNTIRHRLRRLEELAGVAPQSRMRERVSVWWAARAWLDESRALAHRPEL